MNKTKRITNITFETERTYTFAVREAIAGSAWCAACGAEAGAVSVEEAARVSGLSELAIYRRLVTGTLHFTETAAGRVVICLNSLLKSSDKPRGETS